jgi:hypothetical protein
MLKKPLVQRRVWIFPVPYLIVTLIITGYFVLMLAPLYLVMGARALAWPMPLLGLIPLGILVIGTVGHLVRSRMAHAAPGAPPAPIYVPAPPLSRRQRVALALLLVPLVSGALAYPLYFLYSHPTSTAPSSWTAQLALAQQAAGWISKEAVLESIAARPIVADPARLDERTTFELDFTFVRPSGQMFRVTLVDADPPRLVGWPASFGSREALSADEQAAYRQALATVQYSARDVYRQTLEEGRAFGQGSAALYPYMSLFVYLIGPDQQPIPSRWNIMYSADGKYLNLQVNAQTGQITKREQH